MRNPFLLSVPLMLIGYFLLTHSIANHILPPARQSVIFLEDVLSGKFPIRNPKVLILGDSTAGFNYTAGVLPDTLTLSMFSGSFAEHYYAFKRYLEKYPAPKCVILTASYNWSYHRADRFWDIYPYHNFYSWKELNDIYDTSRKVGDFPATEFSKPGFLLTAGLYRLHLRGIHMEDVQSAFYVNGLIRANRSFWALMRQNSGSINKSSNFFPFIWDPHAHLNKPFQAAPLYDAYFERIVELVHDVGAQLHFIQSPISELLVNENSRKFFNDLHRHFEPIIHAYPGNTYNEELKVYPNDLMFSGTHLNVQGALRFTEENRKVFEDCQ